MGRAIKQRNFLAQPGRNCLPWIDIREVHTFFHGCPGRLVRNFSLSFPWDRYGLHCTVWDDENGTQILSQPYPGSAESSLVNASASNTVPSAQGIQHLPGQ